MASTFTPALGLERQATGENSNQWGTKLNENVIDLIDTAIAVRLALSVAGASDVTLTTAQALNAYHEYTGILTGNISVIVPTSDKAFLIFNNTTGAFTLTVKTAAGTGVIVPQGSKTILYSDSTNVVGIDTLPNLRQMKGADVASASDLLVGIDGNIFDVTGTTQIDTIATKGIGTVIKLHFDGILTLAHDATNLILPGAANITTAAGDEAEFYEYASADWRCTSYTKATGGSVTGVVLNSNGGLTLTHTGADATEGPVLDLFRSSDSPAADDAIGAVRFSGKDDADAYEVYGDIRGSILDPAAASTDFGFKFIARIANTLTEIMKLGPGAQIGSPTGGDKGVGTINAENGLYDNGTQVGVLRSYIDGLILSNDPTDALKDIGIAAGEAADDGKAVNMVLAAALIKKLDAAWAVGTNAGALDGTESVGGTPDASTWYHIWLIRRSDTGVVDILASESATAPTMPTNYDQKRRVGAVLFDATPDIITFFQDGDYFFWDVPVQDYDDGNPGTSAVTRTLTVPTGIVVKALHHFKGLTSSVGNAFFGLATSLDQTNSVPSATKNHVDCPSGNYIDGASLRIRTDTSGQIRTRVSNSTSSVTVYGTTEGWIDPRGRNA